MRRTDQRREAAFALYQQQVTGRPLEDLLGDSKPFTRALAEGAFERREQLDGLIAAHAHGWSLERIAPLEKAIMRIALYEILDRDDVPTPVAIDEAVSIAGKYCGAQAPGFVNGILSAASGSGRNGVEPVREMADAEPGGDDGGDGTGMEAA
jgi:transcription antitermination protein NusB